MDGTANLAEEMLGGSGAPGNEAPETKSAGDNGGSAGTQAAAWTNQLSKELRENNEAFGKVSNFRTVSELAEAYIKGAGEKFDISDPRKAFEALGAPKEGEPYGIEEKLEAGLKNFVRYARAANLTREQAARMAEGYRALTAENAEARLAEAREAAAGITRDLVEEFGPEAAEYYRKATARGGLQGAIAAAGLYGNRDLARALVLLGRETSEGSTPSGGSGREKKSRSIKEGATFSYS
jgi:hypothetical protein